jgi:hypothetical protein
LGNQDEIRAKIEGVKVKNMLQFCCNNKAEVTDCVRCLQNQSKAKK